MKNTLFCFSVIIRVHPTDILEQLLACFFITNQTAARPRCPLLIEWRIFPDHSRNTFIIVRISHQIAAKRNQSGFYLSVCKCCWNGDFLHQCFSAEIWGTLQWFNVASVSPPPPKPPSPTPPEETLQASDVFGHSGSVFIPNFTFFYRPLSCWKRSDSVLDNLPKLVKLWIGQVLKGVICRVNWILIIDNFPWIHHFFISKWQCVIFLFPRQSASEPIQRGFSNDEHGLLSCQGAAGFIWGPIFKRHCSCLKNITVKTFEKLSLMGLLDRKIFRKPCRKILMMCCYDTLRLAWCFQGHWKHWHIIFLEESFGVHCTVVDCQVNNVEMSLNGPKGH